jgi:dehydrogenase/reductase SDR family protein 7
MLPIFIALISSLALPDANLSLFLYEKIFASERHLNRTFDGKRIWITGASSGIGADLAKQLNSHGAKLVISGRRELELENVKNLCLAKETHSNIEILPFDVTGSDEEITAIVQKARSFYDGIDILILNAGRGQLSPALDESLETTKGLINVNFLGPVRLALEVMKSDGWVEKNKAGHIVVTSSVASKMALPLGTSYAASKHAVHGYFSSLRSEYSDWLRVDLPCPGPVSTGFQDKIGTASFVTKSEPKTEDSELKMPVERCTKLMIASISGPRSLMKETWISIQPSLAFMYLNQYFPNICSSLLEVFGYLRLKAFKAGLPIYKMSSWVKVLQMGRDENNDN